MDHPSNDAVAITRIDPFRICPEPDSSDYNFVETQRVTLFELGAGLIRNGYPRGIGSMVHTASEVDGPLKSGSSKSEAVLYFRDGSCGCVRRPTQGVSARPWSAIRQRDAEGCFQFSCQRLNAAYGMRDAPQMITIMISRSSRRAASRTRHRGAGAICALSTATRRR